MIEIEMPGDLKEFKPKIIAGLTLRQCVLYPIAAIGLYLVYNNFGASVLGIFLMIIVGIPPILCASFEPYGVPMEKFFLMLLTTYYLPPRIRKYKINNMYDECIVQETDEEKRQRILKSRKKKAKNQKSKNPEIMAFK